MYFSSTQINPPYSKAELENSKRYAETKKAEEKKNRIAKLTEDIKYCNEQISDIDFINSTTPENVKALLIFRLMLVKEKNELLK